MEIESIIFYTCYEVNIVSSLQTSDWSWTEHFVDKRKPCKHTRDKQSYKISGVAFLCSACCSRRKLWKHFHLLTGDTHKTYSNEFLVRGWYKCKIPLRKEGSLLIPKLSYILKPEILIVLAMNRKCISLLQGEDDLKPTVWSSLFRDEDL